MNDVPKQDSVKTLPPPRAFNIQFNQPWQIVTPCVYGYEDEKYRLPNGNIDMRMIPDSSRALGGPELMLLKHSKYQDQQEYRILWELDTLNGTFIDVIAPRARQFCRKVDAAEYQAETIAGQRQHLEPVEGKPSEPETGIERRCINAEVHFS